jgi:hypothetical protein
MTLADYSMTAFALLNGGRVIAYFPQMIRVHRDPHGAAAVSLMTWMLFAAANVATVCYALTVSNDRVVAIVFALNAVGCVAIAALTFFKRMRMSTARRRAISLHRIASLRHSQRLVEAGWFGQVQPQCGVRHDSPREQHRDEMIRQGLMS